MRKREADRQTERLQACAPAICCDRGKSHFGVLMNDGLRHVDQSRTLTSKWLASNPRMEDANHHTKTEPETLQDILTCGVCQKDFALSDIVKFIQHKVHACNKENYFLFDDRDYDSDGDGSSVPIVNSRRPSISAPISKKERLAPAPHSCADKDRDNNGGSPRPSSVSSVPTTATPPTTTNSASSSSDKPAKESPCVSLPEESSVFRETEGDIIGNNNCSRKIIANSINSTHSRPKQVDSETNTTNTEPNNYTCSTCKLTFNSAWYLLQHVQNMHGMKIYVESPVLPATGASAVAAAAAAAAAAAVAAGNAGAVGPLPGEQGPPPPHLPLEPHPPHPFTLLRMPLAERQFGPALNSHHNPFARPSSHHNFSMDLLNDQFRLNHPGLGLPPFDHHHHPFERPHFERPRSIGLGLEPSLDFYSQRLRQLAGTTSPTTSPSPRKLTPPFSSPQPPSSQSSTPQPSHTPVTVKLGGAEGCSSSSSTTPKLKACEFCGKVFRFQSNLIVHRRSHTGEKPYKCHICNHACTQASKLKRHMKTHMNKSPGSTVSENTSIESTSSTPDSKQGNNGNKYHVNADEEGSDAPASVDTGGDEMDDDEDVDEDEEAEDEDEEMMLMDEDELGSETAEDLTTKSASASVTPTPAPPGTAATNHSSCHEKQQSVLGEVMEKTGLSNIQQYNDAYKQALEESNATRGIKEERHVPLLADTAAAANSQAALVAAAAAAAATVENGLERTMRLRDEFGKGIIGQPPLDLGHGLLGAFDNPFDASKRIKLELSDHHSRERESLYAGLWLPAMPTPRDIFVGVPSSEPDLGGAGGGGAGGGGLGRSKPSNESALKSVGLTDASPKPGTSSSAGLSVGVVMPTGNSNSSSNNNNNNNNNNNGKPKEQRRNDTCEYCGKVFKNCSNLTVHRRSHTGEKPYKCELCSYACAQSSKLTRHMKTHGRVGKDVYRCRFCDMPFSVPSTLEKHMRKCVVNQNNKTSETDTDSKEAT